MTGNSIQQRALRWARKSSSKKKIVQQIIRPEERVKSTTPEVLFMAGSPGAGKTEISKNLNKYISADFSIGEYARLDADELRAFIDEYNGSNAHLFQNHVSILMDHCISYVIKNKINVIVDGTFSNRERAQDNIQKFKKAGFRVGVIYVYQDPFVAWRFTQAREKVEGRRIRKDTFISSFFNAFENVATVQKQLDLEIKIIAIKKNLENQVEDFKVGVQDIKEYINVTDTTDELEEKLHEEEFK